MIPFTFHQRQVRTLAVITIRAVLTTVTVIAIILQVTVPITEAVLAMISSTE